MAKVIFIILLILANLHGVFLLFRMTKIHCESYNNSIVILNKCRLRPISRTISKSYMNVTITQPIYKISVRGELLKKANGFKPFLVNITIDACEYLVKRNNPIVNLIFGLFKEFSNINHTCPYVGHHYLDGFYLKYELLNQLPLPNGEYALLITWYLEKIKGFSTDVYFEFKMD